MQRPRGSIPFRRGGLIVEYLALSCAISTAVCALSYLSLASSHALVDGQRRARAAFRGERGLRDRRELPLRRRMAGRGSGRVARGEPVGVPPRARKRRGVDGERCRRRARDRARRQLPELRARAACRFEIRRAGREPVLGDRAAPGARARRPVEGLSAGARAGYFAASAVSIAVRSSGESGVVLLDQNPTTFPSLPTTYLQKFQLGDCPVESWSHA